MARLRAAAEASGISPEMAAANILRTITGTLGDDEPDDGPPDQFLLGVGYQAGPDPRIAKGADGGKDYIEARDLERAAWSYMLGGHGVNAFHTPGTEGIAKTVESMIYRNPIPWVVSDDLIVRKGDWLVGVLVSDQGWQMHLDGKLNAMSPEGVARRRRGA